MQTCSTAQTLTAVKWWPCRHDALKEEQKEGLGGFSFPVTPSPDDMDSKLFKSWASVRSSSTSEIVNNLDDLTAASADYADDGEAPGCGFGQEMLGTLHHKLCGPHYSRS